LTEPHPDATDRSYESITPGDEAAFSRVIDEPAVAAFAALTGDYNPLHMDREYAAATEFGQRVAHGMLVASYFSTLVGMYLPGRRALFLAQQVQFTKPVTVGERITFRGRVRHKADSLRLLDIETSAFNDAGEEVVRGRAQVKVLR
jgi:3-hydroxybutyryl-CoA dehydratase